MTNYTNTYACMQKHNGAMKTSGYRSLRKYTSHFIWKVCVWEEVGDRIELQHIDPHSYGHNSDSLPFSRAAQQGTPSGAAPLGRKFASRLRAPNVEPLRLASSTQLSNFLQILTQTSAHFGAWPHPHPVTPFRLGLLWHLRVTCSLCARSRVTTCIKVAPN